MKINGYAAAGGKKTALRIQPALKKNTALCAHQMEKYMVALAEAGQKKGTPPEAEQKWWRVCTDLVTSTLYGLALVVYLISLGLSANE